MRNFAIIVFLWTATGAFAQFAPAAGEPGSTAISRNSPAIERWATSCEVERGWQYAGNTSLGKTTYGSAEDAVGPSDPAVVSLGDGGSATLQFAAPITNREGWDFAVFENGFSDTFLELAFVEVSSDGVNFVRFPAISHTQTTEQIGPFGEVDAEKIHNLAGKYRAQFGTPFDLAELVDSAYINIDSIVFVRVVDVVGSIDPAIGTRDSEGNMINELYPTAFESGGFDLDAVAVLDPMLLPNSIVDISELQAAYPNPARRGQMVMTGVQQYTLWSSDGRKVDTYYSEQLDTSPLEKGMYMIVSEHGVQKLMVE